MGFYHQPANALCGLNMMRQFFYTIVVCVLCLSSGAANAAPGRGAALDSLCNSFNNLNSKIRDGVVGKKEALAQLQLLLPRVGNAYYQSGEKDFPGTAYAFPLAGYNYRAIGGVKGNGYIASGYDYFAGNKHGGHPAHDIFIKDSNQDGIDDATGKPVNVLSATDGIVVATENNWQENSLQRGGNYIWVYTPHTNKLYYYAHNSRVLVRPGSIVKAGSKIAEVGRSGANAFKKRSPTHLHFMVLALDATGYPRPVNTYDELAKGTR